jgi:glutamate racemase
VGSRYFKINLLSHPADRPIGIFDSGIGGLTVAHAIAKAFPEESIIYFGDTAHLPYGDKSLDAIRYYCLKIVKLLLERDCKLIVIACNSAATAAHHVLLEFFPGPVKFVDVINPLVRAVAELNIQRAGIIATKATIHSGVYQQKLMAVSPRMDVRAMATPLLVPMIEEGYVSGAISDAIIHNYLSNPLFEGVEAMMLACTHYPLIKGRIEQYFGENVKVLDSTDVVVGEMRQLLAEEGLLSSRKNRPHHFYVSDYTESFENTTRLFYQEEIHLEHMPIW